MKVNYKLSILFVLLVMVAINPVFSQEKDYVTIDKLSLEARADFDYFNYDDVNGFTNPSSGFDGKYLNFEIKGDFLEKFSYRYRQRMNMPNVTGSATFFQGTDIMTLSYHMNDNFSLTAGKMALAVGGWEYDLAPIDVYFHSWFWNNFDCYDVGAQFSYLTDNKNHEIVLQVTNSTFAKEKFMSLYAYNLMWYGKMGIFRTAYSFNMIQQREGSMINYIALGNAFDFGRFNCYLDFMNRGFFGQDNFLLGDFTLIGEVKYSFCDKFKAYVKGGYDRNINTYLDPTNPLMIQDFDYTVRPGIEYTFAGLGFEAYPYKGNQNIRLHGFFAMNSLTERAFDAENMQEGENYSKLSMQFNVGLTWRINFAK